MNCALLFLSDKKIELTELISGLLIRSQINDEVTNEGSGATICCIRDVVVSIPAELTINSNDLATTTYQINVRTPFSLPFCRIRSRRQRPVFGRRPLEL